MQNYFDNELKNIERELTQLKTGMVKSAGVIESISKTVNISVPLELSGSGLTASGEKNYRVYIEKASIVLVTLDWYHEDVTKECTSSLISSLCPAKDSRIVFRCLRSSFFIFSIKA